MMVAEILARESASGKENRLKNGIARAIGRFR
jgi:hypothetical protein